MPTLTIEKAHLQIELYGKLQDLHPEVKFPRVEAVCWECMAAAPCPFPWYLSCVLHPAGPRVPILTLYLCPCPAGISRQLTQVPYFTFLERVESPSTGTILVSP